MAVESTTNINGLNEATPTAEDSKSEGDNHLRLLKVVLRATFPGFSGRYQRIVNKGSNYTLALTDNGSVLRFTAGATLSGSPATLGNGFSVLLINDSTGVLIIDPTGTSLVNGKTTLNLQKKSAGLLFCDGTAFYVIGVSFPANGVSNGSEFPAGTRMLFQQTTPPTGWTHITDAAYNNAALRIIGEGSVTTGGENSFSSVFNSTFATDGHVLTVDQLPAHNHSASFSATTSSGGNHVHSAVTAINGSSLSDALAWRAGDSDSRTALATRTGVITAAGSHTHSVSGAVSVVNTGGDQAHTHGMTMNLKFVDFILAEKQ